jgi:hypothetical protein
MVLCGIIYMSSLMKSGKDVGKNIKVLPQQSEKL